MTSDTPRELTEQQLAAALEHTYAITPRHAAEIAAHHRGKPPPNAQKIPLELPDPMTVWRR